jgi:thiol-disulfide isomerase/thioredoxin
MESPPQKTSSSRAKLASLAVAVLLVALLGWQTWQTISSRPVIVPAAAPRSPADQLGIDRANLAAPPIELVALDGSRFSLAAARGEVLFVNFWATWCPPCREEMPSMVKLGEELSARYPGLFRMVAVSVDEELADVRQYFSSPPFSGTPRSLTVVHDPDQSVTKAYYCGARGGVCPDLKFPETYIVDKTGRVVAYVVGPRDWDHPAARAFLEGLIRS